MIGEVIESILVAEKIADGIIKDAELAIRKIEDKSQEDIEKLQEQANQHFLQKIEEIQNERNQELESRLRSETVKFSDKKMAEAVGYIVDKLIGGASGKPARAQKQAVQHDS